MSHALRRLRAHFGYSLLVQAGHGSTLTVLATALIDPVNQALAEMERVFSLRTEFNPAETNGIGVVAPDRSGSLHIYCRRS